ncbi:hypothetical protein SLEP1_g58139 [Rubroshorea leprosula]|uniref:PB1-like domain-containing protein n=1 Tax=Rubroshorea leprosula TaxID=152421 RepID=A0AAV5MR62_9ROSI|nr:hypothetical protein SLEP1_g58139 [Rubroshorea leprosula]
MRGLKGRRKGKGKSKEDNVEDYDQPSPTNSPTQPICNRNDTGRVNTGYTNQFRFHFGGHFIFTPFRRYVNGREEKKAYEDDFVPFFEIRDDLVKYCQFSTLKGDRFYYLKPLNILSDLDALEEVKDNGDVRRMVDSYKKCRISIIDIYCLSSEYEIVPSTQVGNDGNGNNSSPEILQPSLSTRNTSEEQLLPLGHENA